MNIKTVSYTKTFPIAMYCTEKVGVEFELHSGEDANYALTEAKKLVEEFHRNNNPQLYQTVHEHAIYPLTTDECEPIVQHPAASNPICMNSTKQTREQVFIDTINQYTDAQALEKNLRPLANKYPTIKDALDKKLKELNK
jgi:hypothetical protein